MRPTTLLVALTSLAALTYAASPRQSTPQTPLRPEEVFSKGGEPIMSTGGGVSLADTLTLERRGRIWWDYAREVQSVTNRLVRPGNATTLLVPLDSALMRMPRKPHQGPSGEPQTDEEAARNVERFLAAHIVPAMLDLPTDGAVPTMLEGVTISVEKNGDGWLVRPGDIGVAEVKDASNGRILYIDGVIQY